MSEKTLQHPMVDFFISILIPSVILMKLSGPQQLGEVASLILALAFPLVWGGYELIRTKRWNFISLLGFASVLLTGGIGLLHIDTQWLAVKEAAIPGIIGIAVFISAYIRHPFIRTLLYNPLIINTQKIHAALVERGSVEQFEKRLTRATYLLSTTFFFSSGMNYLLAKMIVHSPSGTTAFNEELGRLTILSYPFIALPSMFLMVLLMIYIWRSVHKLTGLKLEDIIVVKEKSSK